MCGLRIILASITWYAIYSLAWEPSVKSTYARTMSYLFDLSTQSIEACVIGKRWKSVCVFTDILQHIPFFNWWSAEGQAWCWAGTWPKLIHGFSFLSFQVSKFLMQRMVTFIFFFPPWHVPISMDTMWTSKEQWLYTSSEFLRHVHPFRSSFFLSLLTDMCVCLFLNLLFLLRYSWCTILYRVSDVQHSDSQFLKVILHL
mgnify:CR=1 FL=1